MNVTKTELVNLIIDILANNKENGISLNELNWQVDDFENKIAIRSRSFLCAWSKPTYNEKTNMECDGSLINDKGRGFNEEERERFTNMKVDEVIRLEDLVIVRVK